MAMKKHAVSLKLIFFQYLMATVLMLVLAALIPYSLFAVGIHAGLYTYANVSEVQAKNAESAIVSAERFNSKLVPSSCTYVFVSETHAVLQSNMGKTEIQNAVNYAGGTYTPTTPDDCFMAIKRSDGTCILHYHIGPKYTVAWMDRYLPNPDKLITVIMAINCLLGCFIVITLFVRRLKRHLYPLLEATQKMREQNLDFEVKHSGIKEFDQILFSISDMKSELSKSLEKQWRMEQTKKEQTSALAHDIRTPLTIIRGNAELLSDSGMAGKQQEYVLHILKNSRRMEQYLNALIDLTKAQSGYLINPEKIQTEQFIKDLAEQARGLAAPKQIQFDFSQNNLPQQFMADSSLLGRAIINAVSNAVDYTSEHGLIKIVIESADGLICFQIADSGKGFSNKDLKQAAMQFYMGDKSRSAKAHYGMGLFIAKSIVEQHGGTLSIANSTETGGGMVTIEIPIFRTTCSSPLCNN